MNWLYLFIAGIFEIAWAVGLKYTQGFTRLWPSLATIVLMFASFIFLSLAVRRMPLGTAYAIWTGMGVAGTTLLGIVLFSEPLHFWRLFCLLLIFVGIIGLKIASPY